MPVKSLGKAAAAVVHGPCATPALPWEVAAEGGGAAAFALTDVTGLSHLYMPDANKTIITLEVDVWGPAVGSVDLTAESSSQRPLESLADSDMNGQDALSFIGATSDTLQEASVGGFDFLHEAAATTFGVWYKASNTVSVLYDTNNGHTVTKGHSLIHNGVAGANGVMIARVCTGVTAVVNLTTAAATASTGSVHFFVFRHRPSGSPEYDLRVDGASIGSGSLATPYVAGNSGYPLHVGDTAVGANSLDGKIGALGFAVGYVPDDEVLQIEALLAGWAP
jgi:hypothetical protein